jgi:two-component system, chemotaxis family, protein-glutamate methylesterase/glutaminase
MAEKPIRVLIVDDSAYIRKVFREILASHPQIEVVGTAYNGYEALRKVEELDPDVILVDLYMPEMDGPNFVRKQMGIKPKPILLCSSAAGDERIVISAMESGAVDFIQKPTSRASEEVFSLDEELIEKVLAASQIPVRHLESPAPANPNQLKTAAPARKVDGKIDAVVIAASTGGPQALRYLLPLLPASFPVPIAIVIHMPVGYTGPFAQRLNEISAIEVVEAKEDLEMKAGRAILAQAGYQLYLVKSPSGSVVCHLDKKSISKTAHTPSADVLFRSAASIYHSKVLAVVLTGMGRDGTEGAAWIKSEGGMVFAESEETSIVFGMPAAVIGAGLSDRIIPLQEVIEEILESV